MLKSKPSSLYRVDEDEVAVGNGGGGGAVAPTEAQMKLAIAQTLSMGFAYNAPVVVLKFDVAENGNITGVFKDAARPRVFSFTLDGESVAYKPYKPGKMDSLESEEDVQEWEAFSEGYGFRVDAGVGGAKKPQCVKPTAYNCGSACINVNKNCKSNAYDSVSKDRMKKLAEIAKSYTKARRKAKPLSDEEFELEKKSIAADKKLAEVKSQRKQGVPRKEGEGVLKKSKDPVTKDIIKRGKIKTPEQAKEIIDHLKKTFSSKGEHTEGAATALIEGFKIKNKVQADIMISKLEKHLADQKTPEAKPKAESKKPSGQKSTAKKTTEPKVKPDPKVESKPEAKSSPKSKANPFYSDEPIKDYDTFKKEISKELARINFENNYDGLIPIPKMREELKGRVKAEDFDKWMLRSQADNDNIQLGEGKKQMPGGIKTELGAHRDYIRFFDKEAMEKARTETKRKPGQITDPKEFEDVAMKSLADLDKDGKYGNLIPIHELRKSLGDKVSRGDFNNLLMEMQANDKVQLIGGEMTDSTPKKVEDSITTRFGGVRYYVKILKD